MELSLTKNLIDYKWKSTYLKWNLSGRLLQRLILWRFIISFCEVLIKLMFRDMSAGGQPLYHYQPRHSCFSHSRTAVTLMKRFCKENPVERIGYQKDGVWDIKKHRWFQVSSQWELPGQEIIVRPELNHETEEISDQSAVNRVNYFSLSVEFIGPGWAGSPYLHIKLSLISQ